MIRRLLVAGAACVAVGAVVMSAQTKAVPRPPAQAPGQPPAGESAAPDGYQPIPQWLGQTHAPVPAKTETFTVETFAEGLTGAFSFHFLPDGRIIVGERGGRIKIVGKDGKISNPLDGLPEIFVADRRACSKSSPTGRSRRTGRCISRTPRCPRAQTARSCRAPRAC